MSRQIALSLAFTVTDLIAVPAKLNQKTSHTMCDATRPDVGTLVEIGSASSDVQPEE